MYKIFTIFLLLSVCVSADEINLNVPYGQNQDILRSSVFLPLKTNEGTGLYLKGYPDHNTCRISSVEIALWRSVNYETFKYQLLFQTGLMKEIDATHKKVIIVIAFMPGWLSDSTDTHTLQGFWTYQNARPPKDMAMWNQMMRDVANYFKNFKNVQRYYEFWNEPDLFYWQGNRAEYLDLYKNTAEILKSHDPDAKVGATAINYWAGKLKDESALLNNDMIEFAFKNKVPLDFISWHNFFSDKNQFTSAKDTFMHTARIYGMNVESVVSEWNLHFTARGTQYASALMADQFLGLYRNNIRTHTFSAWEDFTAEEKADGYGLMNQKQEKRPVFHVYEMFDRISRDSQGIAYKEYAGRKYFISKKADGVYEIVLWNTSKVIIDDLTLEFPNFSQVLVQEALSVKQFKDVKPYLTKRNKIKLKNEECEVIYLRIKPEKRKWFQ